MPYRSRTTPDAPTDRLADRILFALQLAIEQKDLDIADPLARCLEMAMTRSAGGAGFVERRTFSDDAEKAFKQLSELRAAKR